MAKTQKIATADAPLGAEQETDIQVDVPQWQLELDRVGLVRRMFLARRRADWWFVVISAILLLFVITVGIFPSWFAPYDPRAEVGPSLLSPGQPPSEYVLVTSVEAGITSLRQVADRDNRIGYVLGTAASQALREALDQANAAADAEGLDIRYQPRPSRYESLDLALDALAAGETDAVVASPGSLDAFLGSYPTLEISGSLVEAAERGFVMGTNQIGQDVLSRIIWGTRIALIVGLSSAIVALFVGVPLGLVSGYVGGALDRVLTLLMDSLYSFPGLILAIAIAAVLGAGIGNIIVAIAVLYVPTYYRIVRGQTLAVKEELYVEAARSLGATSLQIMKDYIFPNVIPSVVIIFSVNVADAILTEAGLSFLGFGIPPDTPDWGIDLARGQDYLRGLGGSSRSQVRWLRWSRSLSVCWVRVFLRSSTRASRRSSMTTNDKEVLAQIRDLSVTYHTRLGSLSAVQDVSFDIYRGEILGLVGESGCGKSTMGKALMRMIAPPGKISDGQIIFDGEDIMGYDDEQMRDFRGRRVSMIFQDPMTSLNPVQRVDEHVVEAIQVHEPKTSVQAALDRARTLIETLGIRQNRIRDYPHQLSGGMRQRVMVGLGLVLNADLVVADEATTSLDVIVEAKLLDEFIRLRDAYNLTILMITHNIALVAQMADRVAVMYAGQLAEVGDVVEVFDSPLHPYTDGLLRSVPNIKLNEREELYKMGGEPPNLTHPPTGCRFHPRCPKAMPICSRLRPTLLPADGDDGHLVHCWLYQEHPKQVGGEA